MLVSADGAGEQASRFSVQPSISADGRYVAFTGRADFLAGSDDNSAPDISEGTCNVTTVGGVVEPGAALMEIVPQSERLIVRARISPSEADNVHQGLPATVRLSAGGGRSPASVEGRVQSVSADALNDPRTGEAYFEVRIAIPAEEMARAPAEIVAPGLPAEVLIRTGSHTMLDYFFSPVEQVMFRSMRDA